MSSPTAGMWECVHGVDGRERCEECFAPATPAVDHEPVLVYFDPDRVTAPAEVCWTCSDERAGRWVPVGHCPLAVARLAAAEAAGQLSRTATVRREEGEED